MPELVGTPLQELLLNVYQNGDAVEMKELLVPISAYEGGRHKIAISAFLINPGGMIKIGMKGFWFCFRRDRNDESTTGTDRQPG
jgi:hypothetical protein